MTNVPFPYLFIYSMLTSTQTGIFWHSIHHHHHTTKHPGMLHHIKLWRDIGIVLYVTIMEACAVYSSLSSFLGNRVLAMPTSISRPLSEVNSSTVKVCLRLLFSELHSASHIQWHAPISCFPPHQYRVLGTPCLLNLTSMGEIMLHSIPTLRHLRTMSYGPLAEPRYTWHLKSKHQELTVL